MKHGLSYALGCIALGFATLATTPTNAQTTANGPYYADPSWDQKLQCDTLATCPRFVVLSNWNSEAVLDRETGLVWEKSPSTGIFSWVAALEHCRRILVGNRRGWRLPSFEELTSLVDGTTFPPAGHPFQGISNDFWSASTREDTTFGTNTDAWIIAVSDPNFFFSAPKGLTLQAWCVRGHPSVDNPR